MALFSFNNNTTTFKLPSSGDQTAAPGTLGQTGPTVQTIDTGHVKGSERTIVRIAWAVAVFWNVINLVIFCGVLSSNHRDLGA